jgi:cysteine sulfinate desulfinase/cysteine desulfurase-like protein
MIRFSLSVANTDSQISDALAAIERAMRVLRLSD